MPHYKTYPSIPCPDPDDYTGGSFRMLIPAGLVKMTLNVSTLTDNFVEDEEYFRATLSLPSAPEAVVVGSPNMAFVTITDETRMLGSSHFYATCALQNLSQNTLASYCHPLLCCMCSFLLLCIQLRFQYGSTHPTTL